MHVRKSPAGVLVLVWAALSLPLAGPAEGNDAKAAKSKHETAVAVEGGRSSLWSDPADLGTRNLFYGSGGSEHVPQGPFTFVKEDLKGTNPKFVVKDRNGVEWKVKLGNEAQPETVATRIVWAVGYFTDEDYFVPELKVSGMPARLKRGQNLVEPGGTVRNVRLKHAPDGDKKAGIWRWRQDPFIGTREWNGLRTLMAVINNWDLKDINNAVYRKGTERVYLVTDLGASFGCTNRCWPEKSAKGNLEKYTVSRFIRRLTPDTVSFQTPGRSSYLYAVNPKEYFHRLHLEWIGRNIPRADARWMGTLLARLSPQQIHDAFRAAGYSQAEIDGFSRVLSQRIAALREL